MDHKWKTLQTDNRKLKLEQTETSVKVEPAGTDLIADKITGYRPFKTENKLIIPSTKSLPL